MSVRRKTKSSSRDSLASHEAELLKYINAKTEELSLYAQYFANSKLPNSSKTKVVEIDGDGFTLQYVDKNGEELVQKDVRIQFSSRITTVESCKDMLLQLSAEARKSLGLVVDKKYAPPGRSLPRYDWAPTLKMSLVAAFLWSFALMLAFAPTLPSPMHENRDSFGGRPIFERVIAGIFALHGIEALVVLGYGLYGASPIIDLAKSVLYTIIFGMVTVKTAIKVGVKRKYVLEAEKQDIKIA